MQDIKNFYTFLKNNLGITVTLVYFVSFINYFIYYYSFGIPIFNYIEVTDLLFFFFEYVIQILFTLFIAEVLLFTVHVFYFRIFYVLVPLFRRKKINIYLKANKQNKERFLRILESKIDDNLRNFKLTIVLISVFFIGILPMKLVFIPAYFIYFIYILNQFDKANFQKLTLYIWSLIIFTALLFSSVYNSFSKRYNKESYIISFKEGDKLISTDHNVSCLNYLGETSKNIFLYDINTKKAKIFSKENILDLQIDNTNNQIDYFVTRVLNNRIFKIMYIPTFQFFPKQENLPRD